MNHLIEEKKEQIRCWIEGHVITRILVSNTILAFFYGMFLFLYEIKFLRQLIPTLHPFLIAWASGLILYNLIIRDYQKKIIGFKTMCLFAVVAGITAIINYDAGIASNIKIWILVVIPLFTFFPVSVLQTKEERKKGLIISLMGAMSVIFVASFVALVTYFLRISETVNFMGMEELVGFRYYIANEPASGMILYGIYVDTNHAAIYALVFGAFSIYLFNYFRQSRNKMRRIGIIFSVLNFIIHICYFPLANSRGAWLCLGCAGIICSFMYLYYTRFNELKNSVRIFKTIIIGGVFVIILCGSITGIRNGMSKLSVNIEQNNIETNTDQIVQNIEEVNQVQGQEIEVSESILNVESSDSETNENVDNGIKIAQDDNISLSQDTFSKPDDGSGAGRLNIWKDALQLFTMKPIFGTGPNNNKYYAEKYNVALNEMGRGRAIHNSYLDLLVDYGIVGTIIMVLFWVIILWKILNYVRNNTMETDVSFYCICFSALVVGGGAMFLSCLFISTTAMYFLLLIMSGYLISYIKE